MASSLQELLARNDLWRAADAPPDAAASGTLPSGHATLDTALQRGGWPRRALTELLLDEAGIGEMQLLAPALRAGAADVGRALFFVGMPWLPYAPALEQSGIPSQRVVIVSARQLADVCWSVEQILRTDTAACVLAWMHEGRGMAHAALRRLQLAAQHSHGPTFLFRPRLAAAQPSPASLRLRLEPGGHQLHLQVIKQPGGWAGQHLSLARDARLLQARISPLALPVTSSPAPAGTLMMTAAQGPAPRPDARPRPRLN